MVNVVPRELQGQKKAMGRRPKRFWAWDNIHHATPMAFPKNTILFNSPTSKLNSLPADVPYLFFISIFFFTNFWSFLTTFKNDLDKFLFSKFKKFDFENIVYFFFQSKVIPSVTSQKHLNFLLFCFVFLRVNIGFTP